MYEPFDAGDRPGPYLEPLLLRADAPPAGGRVAVVKSGGCAGLFGEVDAALRGGLRPAVFTTPVYVGDAVAAADPAFAVSAVREFVTLCLAQRAADVATG